MLKQIILAAAVTAGVAFSQVPRGQGYVFQAAGATTLDDPGFLHTGVGGEGAFFKGFSAGAEIGALYPLSGTVEGLFGILDLNGGYHFTAGSKATKWDPFVTAGYSLFFRSGAASGFNYGGGVVYWFKPHLGIRAEFREHRFAGGCTCYPEFRVGLAFH